MLVWDNGTFLAPQRCKWSDYYRDNPRDPSNAELAPWVVEYGRYTRRGQRKFGAGH